MSETEEEASDWRRTFESTQMQGASSNASSDGDRVASAGKWVAWAFEQLKADRDKFETEAWGQHNHCLNAQRINGMLRDEVATLKRYMKPAPPSPSILRIYYDDGTQILYYADDNGYVEWVGAPEQAKLTQKSTALFQQRGLPAIPATLRQPGQAALARGSITSMAALAATTLMGCQQHIENDTADQDMAGLAVALWFCLFAPITCKALTTGGKWTRWSAWTGVIFNTLNEANGTRSERSGVHGVPAGGQGRECTACLSPNQKHSTKSEVCLKALLPVGFCYNEQSPRTPGQDRKRRDMSPSGQEPSGPTTEWLHSTKSARATILHVEPPNRDSSYSVYAHVVIGKRRAHLRIERDPDHEADLWDFIAMGAEITIFQPELTHTEHARQTSTVMTICTSKGSTVLLRQPNTGSLSDELRGIDLVCGAGGFTSGMEEMDISVVAAVEAKHETAETYRRNWPGVQVHRADALNPVTWTRLSKTKPNAAICSTPCVTFSGAGNQKGLDSKEGSLLLEAPACAYAPDLTMMVMGNVEAILVLDGGGTLRKLTTVFNRMNYDVMHYSWDANRIAPVNKPRAFILAIGRDISKNVPFSHLTELIMPPEQTETSIGDWRALELQSYTNLYQLTWSDRELSSHAIGTREQDPSRIVEVNGKGPLSSQWYRNARNASIWAKKRIMIGF